MVTMRIISDKNDMNKNVDATLESFMAEPTELEREEHCELCKRPDLLLTRHHLIPRSQHNKSRTQRNFSRDAMKTDIALLCRPCHSQVHRWFDNHELASYYRTIERLRQHSDVQKFIKWIEKRPAGLKVRVRR